MYKRIPHFDQWVISAPRRAKRPYSQRHGKDFCPFCPGNEKGSEEVYRVGGRDHDKNWSVRVINNLYPFAPIHEVIVQTPHHEKHFADFSVDEIRLVLETYVNRFNEHFRKGTVCIFGNSGRDSGESIGHPHAQLSVVKKEVEIVVPRLDEMLCDDEDCITVGEFVIMVPEYSQWPDEVWIAPKNRGKLYGEVTYEEIESLAYVLKRITRIFELRHGHEFPHNFYIYPYRDWYYRIMPRAKIPGGFEIATGIFVNTQDTKETTEFIKAHFFEEDDDKIKKHKAKYRKGV